MTPDQHSAATMIFVDMAAQLDWPRGSGRKWSAWHWHQFMLAVFAKEEGWDPQFMPLPPEYGAGAVLVVRSKQSRLTKKQGSDLIEFCKSWAIENGVELHEPEKNEKQRRAA